MTGKSHSTANAIALFPNTRLKSCLPLCPLSSARLNFRAVLCEEELVLLCLSQLIKVALASAVKRALDGVGAVSLDAHIALGDIDWLREAPGGGVQVVKEPIVMCGCGG